MNIIKDKSNYRSVNRVLNVFPKMKYEVCFLMILLLEFMIDYPMTIWYYLGNWNYTVSNFNSTELAMTYYFGAAPRAFVGTALELISQLLLGHSTSQTVINFFVAVSTICLAVLYVSLFGLAIRKTENRAFRLIAFIFCAGPFLRTYFAFAWYGKLDIFLMMLTIVIVLILAYKKFVFLVPVLSVLGIVIHQGMIFMFGSVAVLTIIYNIYDDSENDARSNMKYKIVLIIDIVAQCLAFLYMQLGIRRKPELEDQMLEYISSRIGTVHQGLIHSIHTGTLAEHFATLSQYVIYRSIGIMVLVITFLPIIILLIVLYRKVLKQCDKSARLRYGLYFIAPFICGLPILLLESDTSRFFAAIFIAEGLVLAFMGIKRDKYLIGALSEIQTYLKRHICLLCAFASYIFLIGTMGWKYGSQIGQMFMDNIKPYFFE